MRMLMLAAVLSAFGFGFDDCEDRNEPRAASGAEKVTVAVPKNEKGHTVEQENVAQRLQLDNRPGAIKHLYVISAFSGDVLIYSTVKGKVTSSGKRLTPTTVAANDAQYSGGIPIDIGGTRYRTGEVLQDDGTYGSSIEYLFWFDAQDRYHQHYISGGQILHISDQPLPVKKVRIQMDLAGVTPEQAEYVPPPPASAAPASSSTPPRKN